MTYASVDCPDAAPDRPDVIVFPPVIPLAMLAIAGALQDDSELRHSAFRGRQARRVVSRTEIR
jgi:hypothetical protein